MRLHGSLEEAITACNYQAPPVSERGYHSASENFWSSHFNLKRTGAGVVLAVGENNACGMHLNQTYQFSANLAVVSWLLLNALSVRDLTSKGNSYGTVRGGGH